MYSATATTTQRQPYENMLLGCAVCHNDMGNTHTDGKQETRHIGTYVYVSIDRQAIESSILISTFENDDDDGGEGEEEKNQAF